MRIEVEYGNNKQKVFQDNVNGLRNLKYEFNRKHVNNLGYLEDSFLEIYFNDRDGDQHTVKFNMAHVVAYEVTE